MDVLRRVRDWLWRFVREFVSEVQEDRMTGLAAEIAFWMVLSLVPAAIALASLLSNLDGLLGSGFAADAQSSILRSVAETFGSNGPIENAVEDLFESPRGNALTFSTIIGLYSASRGFNAVISALDQTYDLDQQRGWWSTRFMAIALTLGSLVVGVILLALVVVGPLFGSAADLADRFGLGGVFEALWTYARWPVVFAVLVAWAATVYHVGPYHRSPWKYEVPGALLSGVLWVLASILFSTYLRWSGGSNAVIGALGGLLSVLTYSYVIALVLLGGGEVNAILASRAGKLENRPAPPSLRQRWRSAKQRWGSGGERSEATDR